MSVWIDDLKNGCEIAAREIFDRYFASVRDVARKQLGHLPTRVVDDEDLALSVIDTLVRGVRLGRFAPMKDRVHLWGLLVMITRQQIIDYKRWEARERHGLKAFADFVASAGREIYDGEPTPHLLAELEDQRQHLFDILRNDDLRRIAAAKLEGYDNEEIAELLGISKRTVERKVNLIYECWERELGGPS